MGSVTIDFVACDPDGTRWRLVLVEEGPWDEAEVEANLRRIQERLYGCLDAAIDGALAKQYPDSDAKPVVIQLSCFNVPECEVRSFFDRFSERVLELPDYKRALVESPHVSKVSFEFSCRELVENG
jgi:hypothetical protein